MTAVAVTGLGLVCALGGTLRQAWPRLMAGEHGVRVITRFDASRYPAHVAAEIDDVAEPWAASRSVPTTDMASVRRGTRLFVTAAHEAWGDAGLDSSRLACDGGVAAGTSANYLHMGHLRTLWATRDRASNAVDLAAPLVRDEIDGASFVRRQATSISAAAAAALHLRGPRVTVDTACASGAHAMVDAFRMVARGDVPLMVAGAGSGLIVPMTIFAFGRIGALSPNPDPASASRPFDRRRDGFVLGEGAAAVVLEPLDAARGRGARIYATMAGAATTVNAHSLTDPSVNGETEAMTMTLALRDAGLGAADVDYVAAHGTSTPKNDATETLAIKRALGPRATGVAVSSHKGQLGHTLPAAGAINVVLAAMALATQSIPPTAHLQSADPECDLDYVPGVGRAARLRVALANAFAFGGQNAVIVLSSHEELPNVEILDGESAA